MKTKVQYANEFKVAKKQFESRITDPSDRELFKQVWATASGSKGIMIGLWLLTYIRHASQGTTPVPSTLSQIYSGFILPMARQYNLGFPQLQNFKGLNNQVKRLNPTYISVSGDIFSYDERLSSPVFCDVAEYWWNIAIEGYFQAHKTAADDIEKAVVALNQDKKACVPDRGIDGIRTHDGIDFPQDHKDIHLSAGDIEGLLAKIGQPYFCISTTRGVKSNVISPNDGFLTQEFVNMVAECGYMVYEYGVKSTHLGPVMYLYFVRTVD